MQKRYSSAYSGSSNKGLIDVIATFFVALILFSAIYLLFDWKSTPPPASYADLTAHQPVVPESENAYTYFSAATNTLYYPTNNIFFNYIVRYLDKPKPVVDTNLLKEAILKNQPTFDLIKQGIACQTCAPPEHPEHDKGSWNFCTKFDRLRNLLVAKLRLEIASRQYQEATESCIMLFYFGDRLLQYPSSYQLFLAGCQAKGASVWSMRELINTPDLPDALFEQLAAMLDLPDKLSEAAIHSIKMERGTTFGEIEKCYHDAWLKNRGSWRSLLTSFHLKPNTTKRMLLPYYRQAISMVPLTYAEESKEAEKNGVSSDFYIPEGEFKQSILPNLEGRQLSDSAIYSIYRSLPSSLAYARNNFSATRIAIAYQRYQKKEGHHPESLTDLVPAYLPAIPRDAFDGQPFRYLPKEKLLYSVDKDLKDSKAVWWTEGKSWAKHRDQVYPLTPDAKPKSEP